MSDSWSSWHSIMSMNFTPFRRGLRVNDMTEQTEKKNVGHDHDTHQPMVSRRLTINWNLIRLIIGSVLFMAALLIGRQSDLNRLVYLFVYALLGWDVLWNAGLRLVQGRWLAEHFLMSLATLGALMIGEYPEAVAVMLFYQAGEYVQHLAVDRSRRSIAALQSLRPDRARRLIDGQTEWCGTEELIPGDSIVLLPGDRVPADSQVLEGQSSMDTAAMTGESIPREVMPGTKLLAGYVNGDGRIVARILAPAAESAVSRVMKMVEGAAAKKAETERFITRFAAVYTPIVVGLALLIAMVPPLFWQQSFSEWIYRALILLVVSCPCALVLSIPLGYFAGIGSASRRGLLMRGGHYLDVLAKADTLVFDKTGTLTTGRLRVEHIDAVSMSEHELLTLAAQLERHSTHPIARSILETWQERNPLQTLTNQERVSVRDIPGLGMSAEMNQQTILLGSRRLLSEQQIKIPASVYEDSARTELHLAVNGDYAGRLLLADQLRPGIHETLTQLRMLGLDHQIMLSGDRPAVVKKTADHLGIDTAYAQQLPQDKLERLEKTAEQHRHVVYLGDGINDAPVLARADLGIAMGSGSDAAIESADAVLISGNLNQLPQLVQLARKTTRIVRQNVLMTIGLKLLIISLAVFGLSGIWQAIFADVGVSLLAVFNTLRLLSRKERKEKGAGATDASSAMNTLSCTCDHCH